jgi:hypothetical protein
VTYTYPQRSNTMKASINTKGSNVVVRAALSPKLELIAAQVAGAMQETASLSETLGTLTREAGVLCVKAPDMVDPFVDACRQLCESVGLTEGSFKVYMSNIRGVLRAMVANGYKPKDGQSLRAMYDAAPKGNGANKGNTTARAPRQTDGTKEATDGAATATAQPAKVQTTADARRAAMVVLFGHADDELDAALAWAAKNELSFVRYVKANLSATVASTVKVATVAPSVSTKGASTAPVALVAASAKGRKASQRIAA